MQTAKKNWSPPARHTRTVCFIWPLIAIKCRQTTDMSKARYLSPGCCLRELAARKTSQAAAYYERAAAHGHPLGCFCFGRWLTKAGEHTKAYRFYAMGADRQHLPSMFRVGYSLAHGKGISQDLQRSYKVLKEAAMHGHAFALRELGLQDLRGRRGIVWRPIGLVEILAAVCWGFMASMVNDDSDLLIS
ncbi:tetratricopeptide repeat protein [Variovorax boronicumulans]|uniref:tetratricopeptide repeat protein n=1 Tax=Variovorax boronicumulans TaxID=436515 RepID=UPI002474F2DC|nr:hypothetical protein [Variovorax boronicumulans]